MNTLGSDMAKSNTNVSLSLEENVSSQFGREEDSKTIVLGGAEAASETKTDVAVGLTSVNKEKPSSAKHSRKCLKKPKKQGPPKPKRPLSSYNLFFRAERQRLVGEDYSQAYQKPDQVKRKHRKTHGKVGFAELARLISEKWKQMSLQEKQPFEHEAQRESQRYQRELLVWKEQKRQAFYLTAEDAIARSSVRMSCSDGVRATGDYDEFESERSIYPHDEGTRVTQCKESQDFTTAPATTTATTRRSTASPRSETAALLISLPMASSTAICSGSSCSSSSRGEYTAVAPKTVAEPSVPGQSEPVLREGDGKAPLQRESSAAESASPLQGAKAPAKKPAKRSKKPYLSFKQGKPKRPLSSYNLFFRVERGRLLGEDVSNTYKKEGQTKRKHRKTHGMVGFAEMARLISDKWKNMSPSEKQPFEQEAHQESQRYQKAIVKWKKENQQAMLKWTLERKMKQSEDKLASETSPAYEEDDDDSSEEGTGDDEVAHAQGNEDSDGSHVEHLSAPVSPRSEAAALLVSIPMATHASTVAKQPSGHGYAPGDASTMDSSSRLPETCNAMFARPRCFEESGPFLPPSNLKAAYPNRPLGLVPSTHVPVPLRDGNNYNRVATSSVPNPDRVRRLEELYRLHMEEAASLRDELSRQGASHSPYGSTHSSTFVQQPHALPLTSRRPQYSDVPAPVMSPPQMVIMQGSSERSFPSNVASQPMPPPLPPPMFVPQQHAAHHHGSTHPLYPTGARVPHSEPQPMYYYYPNASDPYHS